VVERIQFVHSDLLADVAECARFDYVISNPPYISESEFPRLPADVRDYEPTRALIAGPNGTDVIRRLIPQAALHLNSGGWLILEISPMIESEVKRQLAAHGGWQQVLTVQDLARHARVIAANRPKSAETA
jgi:release factor glutamine methyltransferase